MELSTKANGINTLQYKIISTAFVEHYSMMNEADTRANLIDPALHAAGWKGVTFVHREYIFTDGKKLIGNKRGEQLKADYLLKMNNVRLAFIEAKAEYLSPTEGLEQVKNYGLKLGLSIVYSTNGHKIYEFDLHTGRGEFIETYPSPEQLYCRLFESANPLKEKLLSIPLQNSGKQERYYQEIAIHRTMEAIGDGKKRVLLTLATGTGKTYIAFQIAYKLYEARWNTDGADRRPKILFLADRNILADQAINAFNYFDKDLVKITGRESANATACRPPNAIFILPFIRQLPTGATLMCRTTRAKTVCKNDKTMPVVVTSSQMLTTGVDVLNVRNIVIVRQINSMTEFKRQLHAEHSDIIDVLAFLQYNSELITYTECVLRAKGDEAFFNRYREQRAKNFLYFILDQYEQHGVQELDTENLSQLIQKSLFRGNRCEAVQAFGGKPELIQQAFLDLQVLLFKE